MTNNAARRRRAIASASWLAIGMALACGQSAFAQQTSSSSSASGDSTVSEVVVTGTRASLQSAIDRKRRAATTVDSIVAEDVGQFPDKNIAESLQRVTGVQLGRSGEGEGTDVFIRGVDADLNRVEVNGMTALSNSGTNNPSAGAPTSGRGASLLEMAPELVASIDVFKGFTADMTEGGVGGTVSITTRKPLDLRKPLLSLTGSAQYLDITGTTKFRGNITAGNRFFDNRFGVIVNVTYNDNDTRGDYLRDTEWGFLPTSFNSTAVNNAINVNTGVATQPFAIGQQNASGDIDNSPDKSFVNPAYADVTSKAGCPTVPTGAGVTAAQVTAAATAAASCLEQWSEYVPGNTRYGSWVRNDKRTSAELTLEYRVSDNLRVWGDYQFNDRSQALNDYNFSVPLGPTYNRINATTYDRNGQPIQNINGYPANASCNASTTSPGGFTTPTPTCDVVIDEGHNVIEYYTAPFAPSSTGGSANNLTLQQRDFTFQYRSDYLSAGFNWKSDNLKIDGLFATTKAHNEDDTNLLQIGGSIPNVHVILDPTSGAPTFDFGPVDINSPSAFTMPAYNVAGTPLSITSYASLAYRPAETENAEDTIKLDLDWMVDGPFVNKVEVGYQYRTTDFLRYNGGGYVDLTGPQPVLIPNSYVGYNINFNPTTGAANVPAVLNMGTLSTIPTGAQLGVSLPTYTATFNAATYSNFINTVMQETPFTFFDSPNYDPGITPLRSWLTPKYSQVDAFNAQAGNLALNRELFNHDNVRDAPGYTYIPGCVTPSATATTNVPAACLRDTGQRYPQAPANDTHEEIQAAYGQLTFGGELFGLPLSGNAGVRIVRNTVDATGVISIRSTETITDPITAAQSDITRDLRRYIGTLSSSYTDALPTFNLSMNFTDKLIGRFGYAKVLARPRVTDLGPAVTCTLDNRPGRQDDDVDDTCTAGNPDLDPYRADQFDLNLGYYYDRDTLISAGIFYKDITSFIIPAAQRFDVDLFSDGVLYTVSQPYNGRGAKIQGLELSAQTALTFLPAPLDGLGVIANYTYTKGTDSGLFNAITGEELPMTGLSKDSYNFIVYYEKGPINARLAYNGRSPWLQTVRERSGNPRFRDGSGYLDGKFTYSFDEHLSVFLEGQNLLGEVERSHSGGVRLTEVSWAGKRYFAGVTYRY